MVVSSTMFKLSVIASIIFELNLMTKLMTKTEGDDNKCLGTYGNPLGNTESIGVHDVTPSVSGSFGYHQESNSK